MARDLSGMKTSEIVAENKALMAKKKEIGERQAAISAELARRQSEGRWAKETDELDTATDRKKQRNDSRREKQ